MKLQRITLWISALLLASCTIGEKNDSYATFDDYYLNAQQIKAGLNACYPPLRYFYNHNFFQMTECASDLMFLNSIYRPNANCIVSPASPGIAEDIWHYAYQGISRANEMDEAIRRALENGWITPAEGNAFLAEAAIARGLYYYFLTCTFGDVPYYTCRVTQENREQVESLPRTDAAEIRNKTAAEICSLVLPADKGGLEALPLRRTYAAGTDYRFSAALGLMIAGKCHMWNGLYDDAIVVYSVLEDIYGHYADNPAAFGQDYPLTDIPFGRRYTPESIWEVPNHSEDYGIQMYGTLAIYVTPSRSTVEITDDDADTEGDRISDIYNGIRIPELGGNARTVTAARPTTYTYNALLGYASTDLRSGEYNGVDDPGSPRGGSGNLAWRWKGYDKDDAAGADEKVLWFTTTAGKASGRPWLGNKFWCFEMNYNHDTNNYPVFRFAGALLNLAEAYYWQGDEDTACKYLNITRVRAGLPELAASAVPDVLGAIQEECAKELFGEFQRKFDLVRWGIWYERCKANTEATFLSSYVQRYHEYYPIPATQVALSHGALDNEAYAQ